MTEKCRNCQSQRFGKRAQFFLTNSHKGTGHLTPPLSLPAGRQASQGEGGATLA